MVIITKFTTTNADEDILSNVDIQKRICERLGVSEDDYVLSLNTSGLKMDFTIFFNAVNKVSINDGLYNDLIEDGVFTLGESSHIKSVKIKTPTSATIMIELG